jgi:3-hydroxypropanoate dehydrogenase
MATKMHDEALKQLFTEARTHHAWSARPVETETLRELHELLKWGPTSVNAQPARFVFLQSQASKERLVPGLMSATTNAEQVRAAPVTVIVAYDELFHHRVKDQFPAYDTTAYFESDTKVRFDTAFRNSTLQGAYLILAARALGLDTCPMSGFDNARVDQDFFAGTSLKSNFICTLGYGDASKLYPRGPRLTFDEACQLL